MEIDPHTGYPMKFERMTDRWSPVYVKKESKIIPFLLTVVFGLVMVLLFALSILGG